ncbi:MAG: hypothetical protein JWQ66_2741 [Mucilaginibacter sp.]|nr:hypothetical protein [Mucilaginibacter sp.]
MKKTQHVNNSTSCKKIIIKFLVICVFSMMAYDASAQENIKVKSVFKDFQAGYSKRDTTQTESFCNKLFSKDIFIAGTGADEYITGLSQAKKLVKNDWAYWMNLSLDTTAIQWHKEGNIILFNAKGTTWITFPNKVVAYDFSFAQLNRAINNEPDNRLKMLAYAKESSNFISEIEKSGLNFKYMIRITGVIVPEGDRLVFKQLVYSFPYPMQRL